MSRPLREELEGVVDAWRALLLAVTWPLQYALDRIERWGRR